MNELVAPYLSQISTNYGENLLLTEMFLEDVVRSGYARNDVDLPRVAWEFYQEFESAVTKKSVRGIKDYICSGDIFEAVEGMKYTNPEHESKVPKRVRDRVVEEGQILMPIVQI